MSKLSKKVLGYYQSLPLGTRLFLWARWRLTFFEHFLGYIPKEGAILDLGCGHGVFDLCMALTGTKRSIYAFDEDTERILLAQAITTGVPNLHFSTNWPSVPKEIPVTAFVAIDVFYTMPPEEKRAVLERFYRELSSGGVVLLKINGTAPRWKFWFAYLEELLMARLGPSTFESTFHFWSYEQYESLLREIGFSIEKSYQLGWWLPQSHHLIIARKPR